MTNTSRGVHVTLHQFLLNGNITAITANFTVGVVE